MREINHAFMKDIGAREEQQDSISIIKETNNILVALGDGMGGHRGGAIASKIFINKAKELFKHRAKDDTKTLFQKIVFETENEISKVAKEQRTDPHTTATLALVNEQGVTFANIGDSRVYIFDHDGLCLRSRDHSVPEMLLQLGEITEEQVATHPDQNKLTKSVGPHTHEKLTHYSFRFERGKEYMILVCSDGFWEYVSEKEMLHFLLHNKVDKALSNMVEIAKERGGSRGDNISVGVVTLMAEDPATVDYTEPVTAIRENLIEKPLSKTVSKKSNRNMALLLLLAMVITVTAVYLYLKPHNEYEVSLKKSINKDKEKQHD